jgi:hypothetical protein
MGWREVRTEWFPDTILPGGHLVHDQNTRGFVLQLCLIRAGDIVNANVSGHVATTSNQMRSLIGVTDTRSPIRPATTGIRGRRDRQEAIADQGNPGRRWHCLRLSLSERAFYPSAANALGRACCPAKNEAAAKGVKRVLHPHRSTKNPERKREQRKRWFRDGQKWRTGCEACLEGASA